MPQANLILDTASILAWLQDEQDKQVDKIDNLIKEGKQKGRLYMSMINVGELYLKIGQEEGKAKAKEYISELKQLPLNMQKVSNALIYGAFDVKFNHAIALADAFTVAASRKLQGKIIAADSDFLPFDNIIWVGNPQIFKEFHQRTNEGKEVD